MHVYDNVVGGGYGDNEDTIDYSLLHAGCKLLRCLVWYRQNLEVFTLSASLRGMVALLDVLHDALQMHGSDLNELYHNVQLMLEILTRILLGKETKELTFPNNVANEQDASTLIVSAAAQFVP